MFIVQETIISDLYQFLYLHQLTHKFTH
jgi:hypothetical protein